MEVLFNIKLKIFNFDIEYNSVKRMRDIKANGFVDRTM